MNDEELKGILQQWRAPEPSPDLRMRSLQAPKKSRIPTHIRVPTPIAALVLAAMLALGFFALHRPPAPTPGDGASLAAFKPAPDLNLRVVRLPDEDD